MIISIFNTTEQRKEGYTPSPWTSPAPPSQTTSALGKTGGRPRGTARLLEIDFLRLVSMLAVISIHVSSTYLSYETGHLFLGMNLAFLLNQAARFSVPLFLLLSGFSLEQTGRQVPYLTGPLPDLPADPQRPCAAPLPWVGLALCPRQHRL